MNLEGLTDHVSLRRVLIIENPRSAQMRNSVVIRFIVNVIRDKSCVCRRTLETARGLQELDGDT